MQRRRYLAVLSALVLVLLAGVAWANIRIRVPEDAVPPFYNSGAGPAINADGSLFALHDGEWAAITFYRSPEFAPLDYDLLNKFDPTADAPLHIAGSIELTDEGNIFLVQVQGTDGVPVWFLKWDELQALAADGDLTMLELRTAASLREGTATFYEEQNHVFGVHPVSHLTVVAQGTLAGGGTFELVAIEVGLELMHVQIDFE
jgi:hypothetical protein